MIHTLFLDQNQKKSDKKQLTKSEIEKILPSMLTSTNEQLKAKRNELAHVKDNIAGTADALDASDMHVLQNKIQIEIARLCSDIKSIRESIKLCENGDYGYCEVCGIEIELKRLNAYPTADKCVDCKSLEELKQKQNRIH